MGLPVSFRSFHEGSVFGSRLESIEAREDRVSREFGFTWTPKVRTESPLGLFFWWGGGMMLPTLGVQAGFHEPLKAHVCHLELWGQDLRLGMSAVRFLTGVPHV